MTDKQFYTIGEVSELCDISSKTLRYYDTINLIVPQQRDTDNNYRYYTKDQLLTILTIKNLRRFGFSLKEINEIISAGNPQLIESSIEKKLVEIKEEIYEMTLQYTEGQYFLQRLKKGVNILKNHDKVKNYRHDGMILESLPEINLFFNRQIMKNYKNAEMSLDRWRDIISEAAKRRLKVCGSIFVTFLNENPLDKFLLQDSFVEFAIHVENSIQNSPEFRKLGFPLALTMIHIGPYNTILNTYVEMINWIKSNNYEICGYCTEEFIISPLDVADEASHITKIYIPVNKIPEFSPCTKKKNKKA
ncbi:MerR family transcriptional regulator [Anaerotignum faecicola]|nr:MerR family transcriptional regulator [Anaerotignum faecicola]